MTVQASDWTNQLSELGACREAQDWAAQYPSLDEAWAVCTRGDWMLWLAGRLAGAPDSDSRRTLVLCACECARQALPYSRDTLEVSTKCIETAEKWARGEDGVALQNVRVVAIAAVHAAADAATADAAHAAANAAYAAYAAYAAAANAAYAAVDAANAAGYAADAAAADAAADAAIAAAYAAYAPLRRSQVLSECASIVRKYYPTAPKQQSQESA